MRILNFLDEAIGTVLDTTIGNAFDSASEKIDIFFGGICDTLESTQKLVGGIATDEDKEVISKAIVKTSGFLLVKNKR